MEEIVRTYNILSVNICKHIPYLFLYISSPNKGKLENPQPFPEAYNQANEVQEKLPMKILNMVATCILDKLSS